MERSPSPRVGGVLDQLMHHVEAIRDIITVEIENVLSTKGLLDLEREKIAEERKVLEIEKKAIRDRLHRAGGGNELVTPISGGVVELNVGGVHFTTTLATLCSDPTSLLSSIFRDPTQLPLDSEGRLFLDVAGEPFAYLLKYLRGERFFVKKSDPILAEVYALAHKFEMTGFMRLLESVFLKDKDPAPNPPTSAPQCKDVSPQLPPPQLDPVVPPSTSPPRTAMPPPAASPPAPPPTGSPVPPYIPPNPKGSPRSPRSPLSPRSPHSPVSPRSPTSPHPPSPQRHEAAPSDLALRVAAAAREELRQRTGMNPSPDLSRQADLVSDPQLRSSLLRALERQRTKTLASLASKGALDFSNQQHQTLMQESWQRHWEAIGKGPPL